MIVHCAFAQNIWTQHSERLASSDNTTSTQMAQHCSDSGLAVSLAFSFLACHTEELICYWVVQAWLI